MLLLFCMFFTFILSKAHKHSSSSPKNLILDTDLDIDDVLAILYILKQNRSLINLKAITLDANAWINPGFGINMLYDLLFMMGRDDIPVGVGGEGGISEGGTIHPDVGGYLPIIDQKLSTAGSCRYRQAIPPGRGAGQLDIDTHFGLRRQFLPQGRRHYVPGAQDTSQHVLLEALSTGANTLLLTGSHTNFALLLMTHPEVKENIEHVYIMGGGESSGHTGNLFTGLETNPKAEFNLFGDPFAAYQVFFSGLPITLVPLEATDTVPITEEFISAMKNCRRSVEANYTYQVFRTLKRLWPDAFYRYFFLWDSFTAGIAISGMLNEHDPEANQFASISSEILTVVTSDMPYGVRDGSNPLASSSSSKRRKFNVEEDGVHTGHVQTGLRDPFCYVPRGRGVCMDGSSMKVAETEGVRVQLVRSARVTEVQTEPDKLFYMDFIEAMNSPHQTAHLSFQSQFPDVKKAQRKPNRGGTCGGRALVFDMDMSPGDLLTLIYLLKAPSASVELKAVTVAANGFANAASIDIVYDVLHMMGRDDIPVGLGAFFALGQAYAPMNTTGDCMYRKWIPQGATGLLDSDTFYGLARLLPRSGRSYAERKLSVAPSSADQELLHVFQKLEKGSKVTILTGGPLTNVARFVTEHAELKHLIEEVVVLGGSIARGRGNIHTLRKNANSEFNMFLDPLAARIVLSSALNVTLVPLDVTSRVSSPRTFLRRLESKRHKTPESALAWKLLKRIQVLKMKKETYRHALNPLSEMVAAAVVVNSKNVKASMREAEVVVEASGDICTDGWTRLVINRTRGLVRYVHKVDRKALDFQVANALIAET